MKRPLFVAISDIHFNINTLEVATQALKAAISKAEELHAPLVIAGDLNDTKAIIRAEVANRLIEIFKECKNKPFVLVGNHDLLNEKGTEHSLNFLGPYVHLRDYMCMQINLGGTTHFIPYQSDVKKLREMLTYPIKGSLLIMHQGFLGAHMGEYIVDKSSISPEEVKDFTVISGHYHKHQTIGTVTYIGSPFTTTFAEANDGPKGFLVVYDDHSFEHVPLNLRKHVVLEGTADEDGIRIETKQITSEDFVRVKLKGNRDSLDQIDKDELIELLGNPKVLKLDKIYTDTPKVKKEDVKTTPIEIYDKIIEGIYQDSIKRQYLKDLWRTVYEDRS